MLKKEISGILSTFKETGWVLEPEAKRLLRLSGIPVPEFIWTGSPEEALKFAGKIGFPLVAKLVSPVALHKSDLGAVIVGIHTDEELTEAFARFRAMDGFSGMLVEEMVSGLELILGARIDFQFGPVILLGIGGTAVEIYKDTALRMAPLKPADVASMVKGLKARPLLEGYRDAEPINMKALTRTVLALSDLVMNLEGLIESMDLNPLMCSAKGCVAADARIMLAKEE